MKPLEMHREARAELLDAVDWYEQQRRGLGGECNDAVEAVFNQIKTAPQRGWRYGDKGHRVLPTDRFPYFVFLKRTSESGFPRLPIRSGSLTIGNTASEHELIAGGDRVVMQADVEKA